MTQAEIVHALREIQRGIEGDNFTWENINDLISQIKENK